MFFNRLEGVESFDAERLADTWFVKFMYMLCRGIPRENVTEVFDQVSFIVFNYDRCIEHFLTNALQRSYAINLQDAASIVGDLDIFHPYGLVGELQQMPFGSTRINCVALAESIKTYTEQIAAADIQTRLAGMFAKAEHIVFLGFAYHDPNMALLRPAKEFPVSKKIFGTACGMSNSDVEVVGHQIDAWFTVRDAVIRLENKTKMRCFIR